MIRIEVAAIERALLAPLDRCFVAALSDLGLAVVASTDVGDTDRARLDDAPATARASAEPPGPRRPRSPVSPGPTSGARPRLRLRPPGRHTSSVSPDGIGRPATATGDERGADPVRGRRTQPGPVVEADILSNTDMAAAPAGRVRSVRPPGPGDSPGDSPGDPIDSVQPPGSESGMSVFRSNPLDLPGVPELLARRLTGPLADGDGMGIEKSSSARPRLRLRRIEDGRPERPDPAASSHRAATGIRAEMHPGSDERPATSSAPHSVSRHGPAIEALSEPGAESPGQRGFLHAPSSALEPGVGQPGPSHPGRISVSKIRGRGARDGFVSQSIASESNAPESTVPGGAPPAMDVATALATGPARVTSPPMLAAESPPTTRSSDVARMLAPVSRQRPAIRPDGDRRATSPRLRPDAGRPGGTRPEPPALEFVRDRTTSAPGSTTPPEVASSATAPSGLAARAASMPNTPSRATAQRQQHSASPSTPDSLPADPLDPRLERAIAAVLRNAARKQGIDV